MLKPILAVNLFIAVIKSNDLMEGIPKCSLSVPKDELNSCLKEVFMMLQPRLKDGVPELNIPSMDPLIIDKAKYQLKKDDFQLRVILRYITISGSAGSILKDVDFEKDGHMIILKTHNLVPAINITGSYKAEMSLAETTTYYEGKFEIKMVDLDCVNELDGELVEKCDCGGSDCDCGSPTATRKRIVKLLSFNVFPTIGNMNINATGLNPDPTLNSLMLQMANEYWQQFYKFLIPETRKYWEPLMLHISNQFLSAISFDSVIQN